VGKAAKKVIANRISEREENIRIAGFLAHDGWFEVSTDASMVDRFRPYGQHNPGTADRLFVRPIEFGYGNMFWFEGKRAEARTEPELAIRQAQFQMEKTAQKFFAYRCPDGIPDPLEHFLIWYRKRFKSRGLFFLGQTKKKTAGAG
jgi:hypothetical protein